MSLFKILKIKLLAYKVFESFYTSLGGRIFFSLLERILFFFYKQKFIDYKKNGGVLRLAHFKPSKRILHFINTQNYINKFNKQSYCEKKINEIFINGYTKFKNIGSSEVKLSTKFFYSKPVYNAHKYVYSNRIGYNVNDFFNDKNKIFSNYCSYEDKITLKLGSVKKLLQDSSLKKIIIGYFNNKVPNLFMAHTMLSKKSSITYDGVQTFHRDFDSLKSLAILIYWTQTSGKNGSTQVIAKSHLRDWKIDPKNYNPKKDKIISLKSKPGDVYIFDPSMSHRGSPFIKKNRLFSWIRFSYYPAIMYYLGQHYKYEKEYKAINKKIFNKSVTFF